MDYWPYILLFALGVAALWLLKYVHSLLQPPKSLFRGPANHVEIKSFRLKKAQQRDR